MLKTEERKKERDKEKERGRKRRKKGWKEGRKEGRERETQITFTTRRRRHETRKENSSVYGRSKRRMTNEREKQTSGLLKK